MPTSAERKAENESAFRLANETLEQGARELVGPDEGSLIPFLCECPRPDCTTVVLLTLAEYGEARENGKRGFSALGHEDLSIERVLSENDRYVMTEKFGAAGDVHEANDPRR